MTRFLVYGAGAVGSLIGGLLARSGHQVMLLGRAPHMEAIAQNGLHISGIWGSHIAREIETSCDPGETVNEQFDVILLTVKSYDTHKSIQTIQSFHYRPALIVSIQNGYGNTQALQAAFGVERVLGARIITGVEMSRPGHVTVTVSADDIRLGPPNAERQLLPQAEHLAAQLREAGIPATATEQYREYLWDKILYNCALNPLGALLRATYGELADSPETRPLLELIIDESFHVAEAHGIPLFWGSASEYAEHFYRDLIPPTRGHYPSMLRDLERRGRTEIDSLNGAIVDLAVAKQLDVPVNRVMRGMIKLREQTRQAELRETGGVGNWFGYEV